MSVETRQLVIGGNIRAAENNEFAVVGRAISYNFPSQDLGGFIEKIAPGAFRDSINGGDDVKCLVNHNADRILGRTKNGTLTLTDTPQGLNFRCQLNRAMQSHRDLYEAVLRHDIDECSFAFTVSKGGEKWDDSQTPQVRTVTKGKLFDVSIVAAPAYANGATDAQARANGGQRSTVIPPVSESVKMLRRAAQLFTAELLRFKGIRSEVSPLDAASAIGDHLAAAHEFAEAARCMSGMADDLFSTWDEQELDDDDTEQNAKHDRKKLRAALREAHLTSHAACGIACEMLANTRLSHAKYADVLGRSRK